MVSLDRFTKVFSAHAPVPPSCTMFWWGRLYPNQIAGGELSQQCVRQSDTWLAADQCAIIFFQPSTLDLLNHFQPVQLFLRLGNQKESLRDELVESLGSVDGLPQVVEMGLNEAAIAAHNQHGSQPWSQCCCRRDRASPATGDPEGPRLRHDPGLPSWGARVCGPDRSFTSIRPGKASASTCSMTEEGS
ncbi:hypothetical protein ABID20_003923 [Rhizobium alvei]